MLGLIYIYSEGRVLGKELAYIPGEMLTSLTGSPSQSQDVVHCQKWIM